MSGGTWDYNEWNDWGLGRVAQSISKENPLFADVIRDVNRLIGRYDYYLAGDIGEKTISEEWKAFRDKWLNVTDEQAEEIKRKAVEEAKAYVDKVQLGYDPRPKPWEVDRWPAPNTASCTHPSRRKSAPDAWSDAPRTVTARCPIPTRTSPPRPSGPSSPS